jgi:hypothetical protein
MNDNENQSLGKRATQFKPGRSGNPRGRPQTKYITAAYERVLSMVVPDEELSGRLAKYKGTGITYLEVMALAQAQMAAFPGKKNKAAAVAAMKEITERVEGKVPLHLKGDVTHTHIELTDAERRERLLAIAQKAAPIIDVEFIDIPALQQGNENELING